MLTEDERKNEIKKAIDDDDDGANCNGDEDDGYGDDRDEDDDELGLSQLSCFHEMMFIWTHDHRGSSSQGCPLFPLSVETFCKWSPSELISLVDSWYN